ncbi:MAG: ParA family protein [Planctomycetia bacterium]|nr:ParA family protein [Planctomycetia bacterium]
MAITVSLINMKGGVGKSTLTVNLAWFVAEVLAKKVLVIDLDPQFNASQYLLGPQDYERHIRSRLPTVWNIFEQYTRTPANPAATPLAVGTAIVNRVTLTNGGRVDLIPSQLELALSLLTPLYKETLLADTLRPVIDQYDLILIDCAPTESILTRAAYYASDWLLVPVKPEYLSTIGLPLLVNSMNTFRQAYPTRMLQLAGVVFNATTDYAPEEVQSKLGVRQIAQQNNWHVFENEVPYSRSFPKGAREGMPLNRTSRSRRTVISRFTLFVREFAQRIGL